MQRSLLLLALLAFVLVGSVGGSRSTSAPQGVHLSQTKPTAPECAAERLSVGGQRQGTAAAPLRPDKPKAAQKPSFSSQRPQVAASAQPALLGKAKRKRGCRAGRVVQARKASQAQLLAASIQQAASAPLAAATALLGAGRQQHAPHGQQRHPPRSKSQEQQHVSTTCASLAHAVVAVISQGLATLQGLRRSEYQQRRKWLRKQRAMRRRQRQQQSSHAAAKQPSRASCPQRVVGVLHQGGVRGSACLFVHGSGQLRGSSAAHTGT